MATAIPAPTTGLHKEEWEDADFDIPEGQRLHASDAESDKEDEDEDWDMEMDLGNTGGAKVKAVVAGMAARSLSSLNGSSPMITIRPPLPQSGAEEDEDDEGVSTIKVATLSKPLVQSQPSIDEEFEMDFTLPSDMTQLSLAPLGLGHRSSKTSLEWGDSQTSSSQSSDTYSNLGLADASPSSNSATSTSLPNSESEGEEEEDGELDGLIIPPVFESGQSGKQLKKILELKKKAQINEDDVKVVPPDPEDDFEMGLVIDDEADLSPSRLMKNPRPFARSKSAPARPPILTRPPSRLLRSERAKSPTNPPPSSTRQFQRLNLSSSPPPKPTRSQTFEALVPPAAGPSNFLSPKPGSLRGQKSHSGLKPPTPPSTQRKLARKASLSSLMEASQSQAGPPPPAGPSTTKLARYELPTATSRAKSHTNSTSRIHGLEHAVPPTRPSTPSSTAALRLTMPSSIRMKSRPTLSSVFPAPSSSSAASASAVRATSPLPSRPPSSLSLRSRSRLALNVPKAETPPPPSVAPTRVLRKPKRQRTYGDGTELDGIEDLPTDREKEGRFRVAPKGYGNRVPGGTYSSKSAGDKGTIRKKGRKEPSEGVYSPFTCSTFAN